jgi:hypothetical protein
MKFPIRQRILHLHLFDNSEEWGLRIMASPAFAGGQSASV